jgi:hypothetical protein
MVCKDDPNLEFISRLTWKLKSTTIVISMQSALLHLTLRDILIALEREGGDGDARVGMRGALQSTSKDRRQGC